MMRKQFTLIELLVVISIILVLAGITLGALTMIQGRARMTKCSGNLHQIGRALHAYANENADLLPRCARLGPDTTHNLPSLGQALTGHIDDERLYKCPSDGGDERKLFEDVGTSYEWNTLVSGRKIDRATFKIMDMDLWLPLLADGEDFHGERGRNYLFADGHIESSKELLLE